MVALKLSLIRLCQYGLCRGDIACEISKLKLPCVNFTEYLGQICRSLPLGSWLLRNYHSADMLLWNIISVGFDTNWGGITSCYYVFQNMTLIPEVSIFQIQLWRWDKILGPWIKCYARLKLIARQIILRETNSDMIKAVAKSLLSHISSSRRERV